MSMSISALVDALVLLTPKLEELAVEHNTIEINGATDLLYVLESAVNRLDDGMRPLGNMHLSDLSKILTHDGLEEANGNYD